MCVVGCWTLDVGKISSFYHPTCNFKIIIEINGSSHRFRKEERRDERLAELGYRIIRFTESQVRNDLENVKRALESIITSK